MSLPLISVILPVYNAESYLDEAVESILGQTRADFEFLITDDGSEDGSKAKLERFAARDERIRLFSRPNTGYLVALNEMATMARGEFLARMDSDDLALPERFERQVTFLKSNPEVVVVGSRVTLIDPEGESICEGCRLETHEEIDEAHLDGKGFMICHPAAMIRTEAFHRVGGYRPAFYTAEDFDLWLRLAEVGKLANLPETLLKYRQHFKSIGHRHFRNQAEGLRQAIAEARQRRLLPSVEESNAKEVSHRDPIEVSRNWAWWALGSGNVRIARKHAFRSLRLSPLSLKSWRVTACALRGY